MLALLVYTFTRIGAALGMDVGDAYWQHRRLWIRLHEKGSKEQANFLPSSPREAAGLADDRDRPLFRTTVLRPGVLTD